jgi:3-methyladenine DNA glycosylase AlkD
MRNSLEKVRAELKSQSDEEVRKSAQKFFKEPILCYGVKTSVVKSIAKEVLKDLKAETKETVFAACQQLWESGYQEEALIACDWVYSQRKKFEKENFELFETWIRMYVTNWAACDTFCNNSVGEFLQKYPDYLERLITWARDSNRWLRRAAAVSLIVPARKGIFLDTIFAIADLQLEDPDDLVQKGYGWMLKTAAEKHEQAVFEYVMKNKQQMPRTALRYAIEKMPSDLKSQAMVK